MSDKTIDWTQLGQTFAAARNILGISQQQASDKLNVTRASIANFERGNQKFPTERLMELASYYGLGTELFIVEGEICRAVAIIDPQSNYPIMVDQDKKTLLKNAKAAGLGKTEEEVLANGYSISPIAWGLPKKVPAAEQPVAQAV